MSSKRSDGGLARLQARIRAIPAAVRNAMEPALDLSADEFVAMARNLAPQDTGDLDRSIRREPGPHELARTVKAGGPLTTRPLRKGGATYDYAFAVEYGTIDTPPQPFFRPTKMYMRKRAGNRLKRAGTKAVKDAWNGR